MGILDKWNQYREQRARQRQEKAALIELIERMVQDSEPSMRNVTGYRRRLQKPVESALGHIEGLISTIPGPLDLSAARWAKDPLIHALFVAPDEIRSLLQGSAELKAFFQRSGLKTAVALLTATEKERTIFGTAKKGEILQHDVAQTAVEFYDHRVVAPVMTEEENRRELVNRGLNVLATYALEEILENQSVKEELNSQRRILALKLKIQHTRDRGLECLLSGSCRSNPDVDKAQQVLAEIDKQLTELEPGSGTSQDFLHKLENVLIAADNVLTGKRLAMRLNWMGVKPNEESTSESPEISLAELEIPGRMKRVAVLVNISVTESMGS